MTPEQQERDTQIIALRRAGHTPLAIRQALGIRKNVVAGVLWRAGLTKPCAARRGPRKSYAERVAITKANKAASTPATEPSAGEPKGPTLAPLPLPLPPALPALRLMVAIAKHGPARCCWPFGDPGEPGFRFCGEPVSEKSYCRLHYDVAYVRTRRQETADAA